MQKKLPAEEDIKKIGRKLKSEQKKSLKSLDKDKL